jgi:predicted short-subunit dehydrogenase-like oxidoreductase (DUF2520 family)
MKKAICFSWLFCYLPIFGPSLGNSFMNIMLLGAGNMAWQLGHALQAAGAHISGVYARNPEKADELALRLRTQAFSNLDFSASTAQVFFLLLSDSAFGEVLAKINLPPGALLLHASGSVPLQLLSQYFPRTGVCYPLQTISRHKPISFAHIPIFIEASQHEDLPFLKALAHSISEKVYEATSEERAKLHLAAVFACNFANHAWALADALLREQGKDLSVLHHLIEETWQKARSMPPAFAQTGPAIRGDRNTMHMHQSMLQGHPQWASLYEALSKSIAHMAESQGS